MIYNLLAIRLRQDTWIQRSW